MPAAAGQAAAGATAPHAAQQQPPSTSTTTMDSNYTALAATEPPPAGPAPAGETGPGPHTQDGGLKDVDPKKDLPTPLQLWRFIFGDLLFRNSCTRDLVWINLSIHVTVWSTFTVLLWAFFLKLLPFHLPNKIMYLTALIAFSSASDTVGLVLCAAVLIRLRDQSREPGVFEVCRRILKHRRVSSLVLLAASSTFVRLIYVTANNVIPLCGVFCIPAIVRQCTLRRKGVAWVEQFDATVPMMIHRRLGYPTARHQAIDYYHARWGPDPWPAVRTDNVLIPAFLFMLLCVILPLLFVGQHLKSPELIAGGLTASIATICFLQFTRPFTSSIYCYAAILYTEEHRNDLFGARWPKLMPNAFRSLAREKEAQRRVKAAVGAEDREGWVHVEGKAVEAAMAVEKEAREQQQGVLQLEEGALAEKAAAVSVGMRG